MKRKNQKKKIGNAPLAETNTQDSEISPEPVLEEQAEEVSVPAVPFDISQVDPAKIELAEKMGIPIKQLIAWAGSVESRFASIQQNLQDAPQKVVEALKAEAMKGQQARAEQVQKAGVNPQQGGSSGMVPMLMQLLAGGGGGNPMQDKMMELMMAKAMTGMDLSNALTRAMIVKIAPEFAGSLTKDLMKKG